MSTIKVDTIKNTSNVEVYTCKAWVNFDGTQAAANMIRGSANVSSITDVSSSKYRVNFATAMPDANYSTTSMGDVANGANVMINSGETPPATSFIELRTYNISWAGVDSSYVFVAVFR
jgi:formylmethanofuran dehydrogenase subunit B